MVAAFGLACPLRAVAQSGAGSATLRERVTDPQIASGSWMRGQVAQHRIQPEPRSVYGYRGQRILLPSLAAGYLRGRRSRHRDLRCSRLPRLLLGVGRERALECAALKLPKAHTEVSVTAQRATLEGNSMEPAVNKETRGAGDHHGGAEGDISCRTATATSPSSATHAGAELAESGRSLGCRAAGYGIGSVDRRRGFQRSTAGRAARRAATRRCSFRRRWCASSRCWMPGASAAMSATNAGFLNIATKSGSNKLHGEAFYIGRPAALTAKRRLRTFARGHAERGGRFRGRPAGEGQGILLFWRRARSIARPYWTEFAAQSLAALPAALAGAAA